MQVSTIGLDIAKSVFQVHGVGEKGEVVIRTTLRRARVLPFFAGLKPCLIGLEACAGAHHWARELIRLGHEVRLMPAAYVKPYVRRQKNDAADAAAICEAVGRPSMRFVPVKTVQSQAVLILHRSRALLVRQRTMLINALRAHLAELGHVAPQGRLGVARLAALIAADPQETGIAEVTRPALLSLLAQIKRLSEEIAGLEQAIRAEQANNDAARRLATIPAIGPITASAIAATVPDAGAFRSGREFAAWLGLTPRQSSTGGKQRLGAISKKGDRYLRALLVTGATAVLRRPSALSARHRAWLERLLGTKPARLATVALANKIARICWAVLAKATTYRREPAEAAA
jgi:transposase